MQRILAGWLMAVVVTSASIGMAQETKPKTVEVSGVAVDSDQRPLAGVTIKSLSWGRLPKPIRTSEDGRFKLTLDLYEGEVVGEVKVLAEAADGRIGYLVFDKLPAKDVSLVLKPGQPLSIHVQDRDGKPVAQAPVKLLIFSILVAKEGMTNAQGDITFQVPADLTAWSIFAHKSQVGFDYAQTNPGSTSLEKQRPLPEKVNLKLDGARTVRFRVLDHQQRPVAGVRITPWLIRKPNYETQANLSESTVPEAVTDAKGMAAIDYLPERFESSIAFSTNIKDYYYPQGTISISAEKPAEEITLHVLPFEKLSGRVTRPDGKPAAGAQVILRGTGTNENSFSGLAKTDAEGRYELPVHSEQQYLVQAFHDGLISPFRSDVVVRIGKPVSDVDLVLVPPIKLRGKVTVGDDKRPVPNIQMSVVFKGGEVTQDLPRPEGIRKLYSLRWQAFAKTNAAGEYEFSLGPGEYQLWGAPRVPHVVLKVSAEATSSVVSNDFHMPRAESGPLIGKVVDRGGKPVANAIVKGLYAARDARRHPPNLKSDEQGMFRVERSLDPLVLYVHSPETGFAGIARSEAEATEVTIAIGPVSSATGTLRDEAGQIVAGKELTYGIQVFMAEPGRSEFSYSFGGKVTTDAEGKFTLSNLVVAEEYHLSMRVDERISRPVKQVTAADPQPLLLGDLQAETRPSADYAPKTPAQKTKEAFAGKRDIPPETRLTNLLAEAKREYTRPLLLVGKPDDKACIDLFRLFEVRERNTDKTAKDYLAPNELRWEFELASLDMTHPPIVEFASQRKLDHAAGQPLLAMLDADGKVIDMLPLKLEDQKLNPREIGAWLEKYRLPQRNAVQMYEAAMSKATAEDKKVFLIFSASWCGPCRMLARFLAPHKEELEKHFVFVKLDVSRDEAADELHDRFPESKNGGVPWFCIVDAEGKSLIDSNVPAAKPTTEGGNMGFPTMPAEVEHFVKLLKVGAPRLSSEKILNYKAELLKKK
jgi:thiol-disulfide isomerase/thioredoxin